MKALIVIVCVFFSNYILASDINLELIEAAKKGNTSRVVELLDLGADINTTGFVPNYETLRYEANNITPLMYAINMSHIETAKVLIYKGADINLKGGEGTTALHYAVRWNLAELSRILIEKGADVSSVENSGTSVFLSAVANSPEIALEIIDKVDISNIKGTRDGYSALHYAALLGRIYLPSESPSCLSDIKAEIDNKQLHLLLLKKVLKKIDDIRVKDKFGFTPLDWARTCGLTDSIKILTNQ